MASHEKVEDGSSTVKAGEPMRGLGLDLRHFEELGKRLTTALREECEKAKIERCKPRNPSLPTPHHIEPQCGKFGPHSPWPPTHWNEIIHLQRRLSDILHDSCVRSSNGRRPSAEDEVVVRDVLKQLQNSDEKIGPGIDHIKIKRTSSGSSICFWVVRVDGTEIDFSYHKCLKDKAAKECPDLLPHYDNLFRGALSFLAWEVATGLSSSPKHLDKNPNNRTLPSGSAVKKETVC